MEAQERALSLPRDPHPGSAPWQRLEREWLARPPVALARELLGLLVVRASEDGPCAGRIVETEAYGGPEDQASHARAGRTIRTAPMFGPPGHAYIYLIYGMHHCLNVVAGGERVAGAVLIRAVEPVSGVDLMRQRRGGRAAPAERLAAGPARLCQALAVDRTLDGIDLVSHGRLWLAREASGDRARPADDAVSVGYRIGIAYAGPGWADRPWRFGLRDHPSLSRPFPRAG